MVPAPQGWALPHPRRPTRVYRTPPHMRWGPHCAGAPVRRSGAERRAGAGPVTQVTPSWPPRPRRTGHPAPTSPGGARYRQDPRKGQPGAEGIGRARPVLRPAGPGVWAAPRGCERGRAQGRQIANSILLTLTRVPGRSGERPWSGGITNTYGGVPASGGDHGEGPTCWGRALLQNLPPSSGLDSRCMEQAPSGECAAQGAVAAEFAFGFLGVISLAHWIWAAGVEIGE